MGLPANSSQNLFDPSVPAPFHSLRVDFSVGVSNARPLCACRPLPSHQPRRSRFHPTSDCSQSLHVEANGQRPARHLQVWSATEMD